MQDIGASYESNRDKLLKDCDLNNQEMLLLTWDRLGLKNHNKCFLNRRGINRHETTPYSTCFW